MIINCKKYHSIKVNTLFYHTIIEQKSYTRLVNSVSAHSTELNIALYYKCSSLNFAWRWRYIAL